MNWMGKIEDFVFWVMTSVSAGVAGGVAWMIRRVLTNQKQIEELRSEIAHRDRMREEDRQAVSSVRAEVGEVRDDMRDTRDSVKRIEGILSRSSKI